MAKSVLCFDSVSFFCVVDLQVWYRMVGLVMDDGQLRGLVPGETGPAVCQGRAGELVVLRSPAWAKATAGRLGGLLKRLISCTAAHRHWRVRLELVELADHLLGHCGGSLGEECMGPLLEALVGAVNDEEPRVRQRSLLLLTSITMAITMTSYCYYYRLCYYYSLVLLWLLQ